MSFSVGFLKPDCLEKSLEEEVYRNIESVGLRIVFKKRMKLDISQARSLYSNCRGFDFFDGLCEFILSGEIEVFVVQGEDAIDKLNWIVGAYGQKSPNLDSIRKRLGESVRRNVLHSTTNERTFIKEIILLLPEDACRWIDS